MTLGKSVRLATLGAVAAIMACAAAAVIVQSYMMHDMGVDSLKQQMHTTLIQAENVRASVSAMNRENAFDLERLKLQVGRGADFRATTLYKTVPVVAS